MRENPREEHTQEQNEWKNRIRRRRRYRLYFPTHTTCTPNETERILFEPKKMFKVFHFI